MVFGNYNAWRSHPAVNPKLYHAFPGFKWAVGIFAVYCTGEWVYKRFIHKPKQIRDGH
ncbi:uncharacterized protein [Blastocystis hominis]|uniref:Uncharacterized protein n=1 Tax=Blastocystis hominis TaxID=12968 RepID=D8M0Z6_BLAHO|nr:uncharacterized protein [Blastocystis hominis]CBK21735.2 unnamed protein product [Blastocystis hominis]|eukprot:XP_012895783.1 uncharacterized protein [Blastocystis hominis]